VTSKLQKHTWDVSNGISETSNFVRCKNKLFKRQAQARAERRAQMTALQTALMEVLPHETELSDSAGHNFFRGWRRDYKRKNSVE
jgi:hypothetical protein